MRQPTVVVRGDVLSSWLTVSDYTKSQLANELGVSRGRISQLLTSEEEPSAHLIAKLLLPTKLPFDRLFMVAGNGIVVGPDGRSGGQKKNGQHDKTLGKEVSRDAVTAKS